MRRRKSLIVSSTVPPLKVHEVVHFNALIISIVKIFGLFQVRRLLFFLGGSRIW